MLSIKPLKSAQGAVNYYLAAFNYYAGDATATRWLGRGCELLQQQGVVEKEDMLALLQGRLPNGQVLQNPKGEHRPGFDMTFSAPKSVSVLVGLGVAPKMIDYHDLAIERTMAQVEEEFAEARVLKNGEIAFEKTGNLAMAVFRQPSSRANDPSLHSHCVVMNMTFVNDRAKSLSSDMHGEHGVIEQLQRNVPYVGLIYRHHLANLLKEDGYQLRFSGDGLFEIEGMPTDVLRHFSRRREDIERLMGEKGWSGAKAASSATLLSRPEKDDVSLDVLEKEWIERACELGFDAQSFVDNRHSSSRSAPKNWVLLFKEKVRDAFYKPVEHERLDALEAVNVAIETLSQKTSVFSERELKTESMKHTLIIERVVTQKAIDEAIVNKKNSQELYEARSPYTNKPQLTTPWLLTMEAETIARIESNKGIMPTIATKKEVEAFQQKVDAGRAYPLTNSQKQAMLSLLISDDRFFAIQGFAGVAKTTMLSVAREMIEDKGYLIRGITVASSAAHEMTRKAGIRCDVFPIVHGELKRASIGSLKNTVFIVDEASMLSSPQGHELAKLVEEKGARLVFVGDEAQLPSVKNGRIFGLIQDYDVKTSVMDEIVRQKNQQAKEAVEHATRGEVYEALNKVDEVKELRTHEERIDYVARTWLGLPPETRKQTLLFAPTHANRAEISNIIRDGLKNEGVLTGDARTQTVLKARSLEDIQLRFTSYYETGNVIRFNQSFKRASIESGDYLTVNPITPKHRRDNVLPLQHQDGRNVLFSLSLLPQYKTHTAAFNRIMEVYQTKDLDLKQGDTILWCRNFKKEGIHNSERATLLTIKTDAIDFKLDNGELLTLNNHHPALQHIDHGYVFTNFKVQGKEAHYGIGLIESYNKFSATLKNFYVQISRAVHNMTVVTDDKNNLTRALILNDDEKKSAIDAVSTQQLDTHIQKFQSHSNAFAHTKAIIEKKALKEAHWSVLEKTASSYQMAKKTQNNVHAARFAHQLLSCSEGIKLANSRMGFTYNTYRRDAIKVASIRLLKTLNDDEKRQWSLVKQYVDLNKECAKNWRGNQNKTSSIMGLRLGDKPFEQSSQRNQLAFQISTNIEKYKPFLKHFSIGELNRLGVPQYRFEEEGLMASKRLDKMAEFAARHQLSVCVNQFFTSDLSNKSALANQISDDATSAHAYVMNHAKKTGQNSRDLWHEIRTHARECKDNAYRYSLPASQHVLFDTLKQHRDLSFQVGQAWKLAFNGFEKGGRLSDAVLKPIEQLTVVKNQLAHALASKEADHQDLFNYFKLDASMLRKQATEHERRRNVSLFLTPTGNFQEKRHAARAIAQDIKGHYTNIKNMGINTSRLSLFMKISARQHLYETLAPPEQQHYKTVLTYQHTARVATRSWQSHFAEKELRVPSKSSLNEALALSAKRDAAAFKIQDLNAYGLSLNKESVAISRLQEHATNHYARMRDVKSLQEQHQGLLYQLETSHNTMNAHHAKHWQADWRDINKQIQLISSSPNYQYALKDYPLTQVLSPDAKALVDTLSDNAQWKEKNGSKKTRTQLHPSSTWLDAACLNDALMATPEATYRAIFGEPKKILGSVMEYPLGLKVTIKGHQSGLWHSFVDGKGGAPIQAIMHSRQIGFKEALKIAADITGMNGSEFMSLNTKERTKKTNDTSLEMAKESALSIWRGSKPLGNTLAETYLKKHRGIADAIDLKDVRFWPEGAFWKKNDSNGGLIEKTNKLPALVVAARNEKNEVTAVQRIYLDKKTAGKNTFMQMAKLSSGVMKGSCSVIQSGKKNSILYITEGPETGASVAMAFPQSTVLVSFGVSNMGNLEKVIKRFNPSEVIIAADNDGLHENNKDNSRLATERAVKSLRDNGINSTVLYPKMITGLKKTDWNDVLIKEGVDSIRKQFGIKTKITNGINLEVKQSYFSLPKISYILNSNTSTINDNLKINLSNKLATYFIDSVESIKLPSVNNRKDNYIDYKLPDKTFSLASTKINDTEITNKEKSLMKEMEI